ncbi:hypothetical protein NDU88_008296 [Pleurodeles waltl]|uniref:Secreted protein n=1 Tax=Pleurodeles waltl TaxID=8319 RepID=A0AAV7QPA9_PLEWA|nr:hypothetical protein NDU88_008296 [Pleurodeles waltl]
MQCVVCTSAVGVTTSLVVCGLVQLSAVRSGTRALAPVVHARCLAAHPSSASLTVRFSGRDTRHSGCHSRRWRTPEDYEVGESEVLRYRTPTSMS